MKEGLMWNHLLSLFITFYLQYSPIDFEHPEWWLKCFELTMNWKRDEFASENWRKNYKLENKENYVIQTSATAIVFIFRLSSLHQKCYQSLPFILFRGVVTPLALYEIVVPLVNYHFLHLTPVQTETSFGVSLFAKHRLLSRSGQGLSASLFFKTCRRGD